MMLSSLQQLAAAAALQCRLDPGAFGGFNFDLPEPNNNVALPTPPPCKDRVKGELKEELKMEEPMETTSECQQEIEDDGIFKAGAKFASFAEFEAAFETWKATHYHPFRVASSETLRLPDGSANEVFKYRYIVYHCAHYGAPRMRGAGKRPNQNYLPCGCRAMLRLNFGWAENALRITTLNARHSGHDVNEESFHKFKVKVRRPTGATPPPPRSLVAKNQGLGSSPLSRANLAALQRQLAASFVEKSAPSPKPTQPSPGSDQENARPLDLRVASDVRSDEERFAAMHAPLQGLTDHLLSCRGPDFDAKLQGLQLLLDGWRRK